MTEHAWFAPLAIVGGALLWVTIWVSVIFLAAHISGWKKLSKLYPDMGGSGGKKRRWVYGKMGATRYNGVLILEASPVGLRLSLLWGFNFGHPPILIPWAELSGPEKSEHKWLGVYGSKFGAQKTDVTFVFLQGTAEWIEQQRKEFLG